jgi:DNA-directed RNA polymerase subunit RPC12/RpoP
VSNNGFFFGSNPSPEGGPGFRGRGVTPDAEPGDVVEVSGEPISRNEAKSLGVFNLDPQPVTLGRGSKTTRMMKKAGGKHQSVVIPDGVPPEVAQKVEDAREHLNNGEIEKALTLAQEAVWEQPSFVSAKVVIARAFIANNENSKALALLQAIPDPEMIPEALFYQGISLNNLGRGPEALDAFKKTLVRAGADADLRKRATDMISRMQGEYVACPMCGRKVLPDSIVDIGEESVCLDCARELEDELEDEDGEYDTDGNRRRKRLRPPLSKMDILVRAIIGLLFVFIILFAMYFITPDYYMIFRSFLPASWSFPPVVRPAAPPVNYTHGVIDTAPRVDLTFLVTSPNVQNPMVGVPLVHKAISAQFPQTSFAFEIDPAPASAPEFDPISGLLKWTPQPEDGGKTYKIVFRGIFGTKLSVDQENSVTVMAAPTVGSTNLSAETAAGDICDIVVADLDDDGDMEIIVVSGDYWHSRILVYGRNAEGGFSQRWRTEFGGRPIGAGLVTAKGEKWLAVADYWTSRIRYFAVRNDALSEMAVLIDLPGRPVMADFDAEQSVLVALCLTNAGFQAVAYRQVDQITSERIGSWPVPGNSQWRNLHLMKATSGATKGRMALVRGGARPVLYRDFGAEADWRESGNRTHVVMDSLPTADGETLTLLTATREQKVEAVFLTPDTALERRVEIPDWNAPVLGGVALADVNRDGIQDLILASQERIGIFFLDEFDRITGTFVIPLEVPAQLNCSLVEVPPDARGRGEATFFLGADGKMYTVPIGP